MEFGFERIDDQEMNEFLNEKFSSTGSNQTVKYQGREYRRRFYPLVKQGGYRRAGKLVGGKVTKWGSYWEERKALEQFSSVSARLDHYFPSARSQEEVVLDGVRYRARYAPEFSRSYKTIHSWHRYWECLGPDESASAS